VSRDWSSSCSADARGDADNRCAGVQVKRITPRHLQLAIRGDEELDTLIKVSLLPGLVDTQCASVPTSGVPLSLGTLKHGVR
jgi:hypothetical protein